LHLLMFSTLRRSSSPTLFPYTTLFRSRRAARTAPGTESLGGYRFARHAECRQVHFHFRRVQRASQGCRLSFHDAASESWGGARQDRKSTRLNSSHVKISYAVFCLKKKT